MDIKIAHILAVFVCPLSRYQLSSCSKFAQKANIAFSMQTRSLTVNRDGSNKKLYATLSVQCQRYHFHDLFIISVINFLLLYSQCRWKYCSGTRSGLLCSLPMPTSATILSLFLSAWLFAWLPRIIYVETFSSTGNSQLSHGKFLQPWPKNDSGKYTCHHIGNNSLGSVKIRFN